VPGPRGGFRGYALGVPPDDFNGVTLDRVTGAETGFPQGAVGQPAELPDFPDCVQGRNMPVGVRPQSFRRRKPDSGFAGEPPSPAVPVDGIGQPATFMRRREKHHGCGLIAAPAGPETSHGQMAVQRLGVQACPSLHRCEGTPAAPGTA